MNEEQQKQREKLIEKFLSILLTAVLSAVITFLQVLLSDIDTTATASELGVQSGALGAVMRGALEGLKSKHFS